MAENILDGFSSRSRIIGHPLPGTGNLLPHKRPTPTSIPPCRQTRPAQAMFIFEPLPLVLDSDPISLEQAQSRYDWPKWQAALEVEYASVRKHQVLAPYPQT